MLHILKMVELTTGEPSIKCTPCTRQRIANYPNATISIAKAALEKKSPKKAQKTATKRERIRERKKKKVSYSTLDPKAT
jgi:uncharacterized Fe-S cluster-containing protein